MLDQESLPNCPKCGAPARVVIVYKARVRCALNDDGTVGRVLSASRANLSVVGYECGGGHEWPSSEAGVEGSCGRPEKYPRRP